MLSHVIHQIRNILSTIPDPEIPVISLEELGMIQHIALEGDEVQVTVTPTYSGCPAIEQISEDIRTTLHANGYEKVKVEMTYSPAWSSKWMSPSTKMKLKQYGIAPPQHCCGNELCVSGKCSIVACPRCDGKNTELISHFGSTACKALYSCHTCHEPFEYFKPLT